ncbi:MAG: leucyl aminopeptidase [Gammaproteobacteria bacterium HGW-Gammaproteobacteria-8]|nr:MAG: leucyl aminopeptidase [Gammaproteobacteria bacterium HGW-Gammaproteobacteria-8]
MLVSDHSTDAAVVPIRVIDPGQYGRWRAEATEFQRNVAANSTFHARPDSALLLPAADGRLAEVLVGRPEQGVLWTLACLPALLPAGTFRVEGEPLEALESLALGWTLGQYRYDRYKPAEPRASRLAVPEAIRTRVEILRDVWQRVRDLVNTPACDLGPAELAEVAAELAERQGAAFDVIEGERLEREFPAIHAVGRASSRAPRLIRIEWGDPSHRPLALVGKGVVFDTGGLDIKPGSGMVLMKKDMGGAAHALGLAELIMRLELPVHLRVYVPAVENAIAGNAYRPSDILRTRNGTTVEIGNTDAEGRVVLSDALTLAAEEGAERIIDFATLTGAARVALGEDLPPLYARDTAQARSLQDLSFELDDPLWHMPLYKPYKSQIQPKIADLSNSGTSSFGGSLTAALFLDHFVPEGIDWMHLDVYAWNVGDRAGRPAGGEAQGLRAMLAWLEREYRG